MKLSLHTISHWYTTGVQRNCSTAAHFTGSPRHELVCQDWSLGLEPNKRPTAALKRHAALVLQVLLGSDNRFAQCCERRGHEHAQRGFQSAAANDLYVLDELAVADNVILQWISACGSSSSGQANAWAAAGMCSPTCVRQRSDASSKIKQFRRHVQRWLPRNRVCDQGLQF
jgi:hypothetical protein